MVKAYIGLDVHKTTISIAIAFLGNDEPVSYGKCSSDINRFLKILRRLMRKYSFERTPKPVPQSDVFLFIFWRM